MSRHRATPQSWLPLALVGAVLLVGVAFLIVGFVTINFGGSRQPAPAVTVTRPYEGPTPTITNSYLIVVTATPGVGGF